jgi:Phosphodiester glycosidase
MKLICFGLLVFGLTLGALAQERGLVIAKTTVSVQGKRIEVRYVRANLEQHQVAVELAGGLVGGSEPLEGIAKRSKALCAINGTFLAAYKGQTGEPYGTLAVAGKWLHLGSTGTRVDIFQSGDLRLTRDDLRVLGSLNDNDQYPNNWYAYGLNQTPLNASGSYVFTPERGAKLGFRAELAVVTNNGTIERIEQNSNSSIPKNGFVVALKGREVNQLGGHFHVGDRISYRVNSRSNVSLEGVQYSLGAGPRLLENGVLALSPSDEGFNSSKILNERSTRSAIGYNRSQIIFAVFSSVNLREEALAMRQLGALEAMNLDGGASSGLWCSNYLLQPGRKLANALVLMPK